MPATKLTDKIRAEVVGRFATWDSSLQVQKWLRDEHGIEVGLPALTPYNFDNPLSRRDGTPKWVKLFDEIRAIAVSDVYSVPIAHKARRLRILNQLVDEALSRVVKGDRFNVVLAEKIVQHCEAAAKEEGGMFTNRRILEMDPRGNLAKLLGIDPAELPSGDADAEP